jgi:hypothetical protein
LVPIKGAEWVDGVLGDGGEFSSDAPFFSED